MNQARNKLRNMLPLHNQRITPNFLKMVMFKAGELQKNFLHSDNSNAINTRFKKKNL